jgi:hypothetical protein
MERFGRCARLAWEHAVEAWRNPTIGRQRPAVMTGHLLLGVLMEPTCAGGLILRKLGCDLALMIDKTRFLLVYGRRRDGMEEPPVPWQAVPHTPQALQALECCIEEADLFHAAYPVGTEHILLSLLRVEDGMGHGLLRYFGLNEHLVRAARDTWWDVLNLTE